MLYLYPRRAMTHRNNLKNCSITAWNKSLNSAQSMTTHGSAHNKIYNLERKGEWRVMSAIIKMEDLVEAEETEHRKSIWAILLAASWYRRHFPRLTNPLLTWFSKTPSLIQTVVRHPTVPRWEYFASEQLSTPLFSELNSGLSCGQQEDACTSSVGTGNI